MCEFLFFMWNYLISVLRYLVDIIPNLLLYLFYCLILVGLISVLGKFNARLAGFRQPDGAERELHKRILGYGCTETQTFFSALYRAGGRDLLGRYRRLLGMDYGFAVIYFIGFILVISLAHVESIYRWPILFFPILYILADYYENASLRKSIRLFLKSSNLQNVVKDGNHLCSLCSEGSDCFERNFNRWSLRASFATLTKIWSLGFGLFVVLLAMFSPGVNPLGCIGSVDAFIDCFPF